MFRSLFLRLKARRHYFAADAEAGRAWADFAAPSGDSVSHALSRVDALKTMANCELTMASLADAVSGIERDEDGFTPAEWHNMSAALLDLVATTEATAYSRAVTGNWRWLESGWDKDRAVSKAVNDLAARALPGVRARLTLALYDVVVRHVGGQAAEALVAVARGYFLASGMSCRKRTGGSRAGGRGSGVEGGAR